MAYMAVSDKERIENASAEDLRQALDTERMFSVEVGNDSLQTRMNATIIGDNSSLVIFSELRDAQAYQPAQRLNRDQTQEVLAYFLEHDQCDPAYEWNESKVPFVQTGKAGCLGGSAVLLGLAFLRWFCN